MIKDPYRNVAGIYDRLFDSMNKGLIDIHPGPYQLLQGWFSKAIILASELAAGQEHFRNYRHFITKGGLSTLANQHALKVEKRRILAGGTFALYLASQSP